MCSNEENKYTYLDIISKLSDESTTIEQNVIDKIASILGMYCLNCKNTGYFEVNGKKIRCISCSRFESNEQEKKFMAYIESKRKK